ncbi:hypothetical protein [Actinomadura oligospora]|uniref:hypothetical protein n=1 Tax=Actinomadura oligospora TaxID=111804 RepID=UPI00147646FB|nr:hypothetical protein [Actinomadura oligospora]
MSVDCVAAYVGPSNPLAPLGEITPVHQSGGTEVHRREYADGWLYEVSMRRGVGVHALLTACGSIVPDGAVANVYNPEDVGDTEDEKIYVTIWVIKE